MNAAAFANRVAVESWAIGKYCHLELSKATADPSRRSG